MHELSQHMNQCTDCRSEYRQIERTRILVSSLGHKKAPPDLAVKIRISLSSARSRTWRETLRSYRIRWQYALDSFMLPAAAGVMTAIFFFAALIGFFPAQVAANPGDDVPTLLYTPPRLESAVYVDESLELDPSLLIETDVDASGRVQNYRIVSGHDDPQVREQLNRALVFYIFAPAQSFGRPVPGKVVISFSNIHVKG
jgi:hypothetical protein